MDEHLTVDSLRGARRLAVWESARAVARSTAWTEVPARGAATAWALLPLGSAALSLALVRVARKRRERAARSAAPVAPAALDKRRLPQIDPSRCLGCYACVDACPFAVLEVQRFVAVVARPADCCGVVACAEVCPNGSLSITGEPLAARQLRLGAGSLESLDAPGVFVAGDVTGVPLIRNAIEHGERVIRAIATARSASSGDALDVLIVGAGPAGLSAALSAKRAGLSFEILEQSTVASSVRSFPRSKIVLDHREGDVANSALWVGETTKELLLLEWQRALRTEGVAVREGFRVANISKKGSFFEIEVANREPPEATFLARNVVLATGRRGTPRRLGAHVADGCDNKVSYSLADARSFAGQRVLVVGLGDAAMEAALALAQQPNTVVTVCHRGDDFSRGKPRNIESMRAALAAGRILAMFSSEVVEISRRDVTLRSAGIDRTLGNDAVLVLIGGEPEGALLKLAGVRFENE